MKRIYTKCTSLDEALAIASYIMSKGYEGVQNDSSRYDKMCIKAAFNETLRHHLPFCFIGVNGCSLVVGRTKKYMRDCLSETYIRKPRVFKLILSRN